MATNESESELMQRPSPGCWVAFFSDWSGAAVFDDELEARRYADDNGGMNVRFVRWGEELTHGGK